MDKATRHPPRVVPEVRTVDEAYLTYITNCPGPRVDGTPGVTVTEEEIVSRTFVKFPRATRPGEPHHG